MYGSIAINNVQLAADYPVSVHWVAAIPAIGLVVMLFLMTRARTGRTRSVRAAPAHSELRAEPPAVVALLVNRFSANHFDQVIAATLMDLAARGVLELADGSVDRRGRPTETKVRVCTKKPVKLTQYEKQLLQRIHQVDSDGFVPLMALNWRHTMADPDAAISWRRQFITGVREQARALKLSRPLFQAGQTQAMFAAKFGFAAAFFYAINWLPVSRDVGGVLRIATVGVIIWALWWLRRGDTYTASGKAAVSEWLGVRTYLQADPAFATLPPSGVAIWGRYAAYAVALGAAPRMTTELLSAVGTPEPKRS